MKNSWKEKDIKNLFDLVEKNNENNIPVLKSFEIFASKTGKNILTIRNFYYMYAKILKNNPSLQEKLKIDIKKHNIQIFKHFSDNEEKDLINKIDEFVEKGVSVREACQKLSGGDIKNMIRLQNKYQNYKNKCKIFKFPESKEKKSAVKLSNNDINSLFLGLVKLVREQAFGESQQKVKEYLEYSSEENRKHIIEKTQQQVEIESLKAKIRDLESINKNLNNQLSIYRIDYINGLNGQKNQ